MPSEADKTAVVRRHLAQVFPSWKIEEGSRTGVDRTLQLFDGVNLKSTIQIGMDLLRDTSLSLIDLQQALYKKDLMRWIRSSPVIYLNNNTLGLKEGKH